MQTIILSARHVQDCFTVVVDHQRADIEIYFITLITHVKCFIDSFIPQLFRKCHK